ncbi:MAG: hypothetical protein IPK62_12735 [Bacteroidetes bacterium]|nr:hypothetical protein [Bacteroidota bacterium]
MKKIIISIALLASCQIVYSQSNTSGKVNLDPSAITNIVTVQSISQSTVDMKDPTNVNFQETVATTKVSGTPGVDKSISRQSEETNTSIKEMARNAELTTAKREVVMFERQILIFQPIFPQNQMKCIKEKTIKIFL